MRLVSFVHNDFSTWGAVLPGDEEIAALGLLPGAAPSVRELLRHGSDGLEWAAQAMGTAPRLALSRASLLAPVPDPRKFLALGGNYASHLAETSKVGIQRSPHQVWFNKQVTCVNGPYAPVHKPWVSEQFDYEGELGVIVGRRCRHVRADEAMAVVAGYVVVNDMSVRDYQLRAPTHTLGKSFDTHGPFGPCLVTRDEVPDPHALRIRTWVNEELRQDGSTSDMIHRIEAMVEELSRAFTLEPGDVLSTGSPAGVGGLMDPPRYLRVGDVVRVEIEGIGSIVNTVVDEPRP
jgi:2-keto-4-pentenoate hydratase/2-oxohepta-3-ene-1,7-dioic acid hydratase in catechol pathway